MLVSIPYFVAFVLCMSFARVSDRLLSPASVRSGGRRYFVVVMMLFALLILGASSIHTSAPLLMLFTLILAGIITSSSLNLTMVNDLSENPRNVPRLMSLVVFGSNFCGLISPIVTGYVVSATGGFTWAFRIASALLIVGALLSLTMSRGRIAAQRSTCLMA
jgi:ACS family glucarate transporter-like MFS transporter